MLLLLFPLMISVISLYFSEGWIRTCLKPRNRIPPRLPSMPQEACAPVLTSHSVTTKLSRWPFHTRGSRALSCPSRRFVPSRIRSHCTEIQSQTYLMLTHEPSASSEKLTVNTWLHTASQTLLELLQDSIPHQQKVPA